MACLDAGGSYNVEITLPTGFINTPGPGVGCAGDNDNSPMNDGISECVDPSDTAAGPGETAPDEDENIDFGIVPDCTPGDAGLIAEGSQNSCLVSGGSVVRNAITTGQVVPAGSDLIYILVDPNGNILQVSDTTAVFTINAVGNYTIHPVVFDPNVYDASTATTVAEILANDRCVAIDLVGAPADVLECCLANAGGLVDATSTSCADPATGSMATVSATAIGINVPAGFVLSYVLTSQPGAIVQAINSTGVFMVPNAGMYAIHTVVHDPNTYSFQGLTIGVDDIFSVNMTINALQVCADINLVGIDVDAAACDNCPFNLYIPGIGVPVAPGLYEVENDITSDGLVNMSTVEYSAGNSIEFLPGFEVTLGTEFEAYIEGCNN